MKPAKTAIYQAAKRLRRPKSGWAAVRLHSDLLLVAYEAAQRGESPMVTKDQAMALVRAQGGMRPTGEHGPLRLMQRTMAVLYEAGLARDAKDRIEVAIHPGTYKNKRRHIDKPVVRVVSKPIGENADLTVNPPAAPYCKKARPMGNRGLHSQAQARQGGRFAKGPATQQPPSAAEQGKKELILAQTAQPAEPKPEAPRVAPSDGQQHAVDALPEADRALLSPEALAAARSIRNPLIARNFLKTSLVSARERVAAGKPPWDAEPSVPLDKPPEAACGVRAAPERPHLRVVREQRVPERPTRLRIQPPEGDLLPADPDWLRQHLGAIPEVSGACWWPDARNGYQRRVWRIAVARLLAQIRERVNNPQGFLVHAARGIARGDGRDPRLNDLYGVEAGWPRELAVFAQVEARMPGWQRQYGGHYQPPE